MNSRTTWLSVASTKLGKDDDRGHWSRWEIPTFSRERLPTRTGDSRTRKPNCSKRSNFRQSLTKKYGVLGFPFPSFFLNHPTLHQVDVRKIKLEVLKPWIATRFTELNGFEDDIVSSMIIGLLEDKENPVRESSNLYRTWQAEDILHESFFCRHLTRAKYRSRFKGF